MISFWKSFSGFKIGVCFSEQIFEGLPMETQDVFVDYVVSDKGIFTQGKIRLVYFGSKIWNLSYLLQ